MAKQAELFPKTDQALEAAAEALLEARDEVADAKDHEALESAGFIEEMRKAGKTSVRYNGRTFTVKTTPGKTRVTVKA